MLSEVDRVAIEELRERLRRSIIDGNATTYAGCFAEDAVLMHPDSPQIRGRDAIATYIAAMFEAVSVPLLELMPVVVAGDGQYAFEVGAQECQIEPAVPGFKRERQHLHAYVKAADGVWYIAAAMSGNQ